MNWRPLVYTSILLATKFYEDRFFKNIDVVNKLKIFDLASTNRYEHTFLDLMNFELSIRHEKLVEYFNWLVLYHNFIEEEWN